MARDITQHNRDLQHRMKVAHTAIKRLSALHFRVCHVNVRGREVIIRIAEPPPAHNLGGRVVAVERTEREAWELVAAPFHGVIVEWRRFIEAPAPAPAGLAALKLGRARGSLPPVPPKAQAPWAGVARWLRRTWEKLPCAT
jgi:hypothetical protein